MIRVREIKVPILSDNKEYLLDKIRKVLRINKHNIKKYNIVKKSIDARDKNNILYVYELDIDIKNEKDILRKNTNKNVSESDNSEYEFVTLGNEKMNNRPIIIGSGPSGLFCAYMLAYYGYRPIIIERGEKIEDRIKTVDNFFKTNKLNPNSNIQFGEGGAGTFSDGKLNTMTKDKYKRHKKVFEIFVQHGAPKEIMYLNKPHIGTDILRNVIINLRNKILSMGGSIRYNSQVTDLIIDNNCIKGVVINHNEAINSNIVVLAIGHSARDTYYMLNKHKINMKPKNFAMGIRVEHPKELIDNSQYGKNAKYLPSADYKLTYNTNDGRSVYSFCMCPGGFVVNASSEQNMLCVNGMSNYNRNEKNSNSAIVVNVTTDDYNNELFGGLELQRNLEKKAYIEGKGLIPIQLYKDFVNNRQTKSLGNVIPNTKGNYSLSNLNNILPEYITSSIKEAIPKFGKKIKGFDSDDTVLLGIESRTSSPIIIERDDNYISSIEGIYPCGEGAGYAGGITTSAVDGIKVAEKIASKYKPFNK